MLPEMTVKVTLVFSFVETGEVFNTLEIPSGHFTCKEEKGFTCIPNEKGEIDIEPNNYYRGQLQWWGDKGNSYDDFKTDMKR